jgi:hypothetical protein
MINQRTKKEELLKFFFRALDMESCKLLLEEVQNLKLGQLLKFSNVTNHSLELSKKFLVKWIESELNKRNKKEEKSSLVWNPKISSFQRLERVNLLGYEEYLSKDLILNQYDLQTFTSLVYSFLKIPLTLNLSLKEFTNDLNEIISVSLENKKEIDTMKMFQSQELIRFSTLEFQVLEILPNAQKFPNFCSKIVYDLQNNDLVYKLMKMNTNLWDSLYKNLPIIFIEVIDESFNDNFSQIYTSNCSNSLKDALLIRYLKKCKFPHQVILEPFLHDFFEEKKIGEIEIKHEFPDIWDAIIQTMANKSQLILLMKFSKNWELFHDYSTAFFYEIYIEHFIHDYLILESKRMSDELKCTLIGLYLKFNSLQSMLSNVSDQPIRRISEYFNSIVNNNTLHYSEKLLKRFQSLDEDLKIQLLPTNGFNKLF